VNEPARRRAEVWPPILRPFGDTGVLVELEGESSLQRAARVHQVAAWIAERCPASDGWGCPVPGATSVLVPFDPVTPGPEVATRRLSDVLAAFSAEAVGDAWPASPPVIEIRVRYGGQSGPDLEAVAAASGLPPEDVILLHASRIYRVLFLGFVAGFAYCGTLPAELALPRRATPRTRVEAGSVVIAGRMTSVLPVQSPSGWHVIGHTSEVVWDPTRSEPARLQPGDAVRFVPEEA
jgi:KipI family sensor histidine kinase inhibitor